ncbi:hemerythrin domain-containing protein [Neptuniibacter sp. SY11_33]|uniref:hemerythrin domain-containing protein n=1 Tax=Neptuniibacter sp. SY11_33 TaxID=3398215 RepID=UPI0039F45CFE
MKRVEALIPLSHDHHKALVTVKHINDLRKEADREVDEYWQAKREVIYRELKPHFDQEERALLPLLIGEGEPLADRLVADHKQLLSMLDGDDSSVANRFAELLKEHVRFEERNLFPWLELNYEKEALAIAMAN